MRLTAVTLDTDTTVHTLFGKQMGGRKSYNPKNKGKKSYQPILTFLAETREYVGGELRNGDRPSGRQIARHLEDVCAALPTSVRTIYARADSGFYCWQAVEAYQARGCQFILAARKTARPNGWADVPGLHWALPARVRIPSMLFSFFRFLRRSKQSPSTRNRTRDHLMAANSTCRCSAN